MQSFIHTTGKFLWWLTPELFKALVRLKFLPFVLGTILLKLKKKNTENLYSKQHYFSKHHFTLLTKITESSEILQKLTCSDESANSCFTAAKLHCPSYREKGINARQHKKKNVLIKTIKISWLCVQGTKYSPQGRQWPFGQPTGGGVGSTAPQGAAAAVGTGADSVWLTGRWRELPEYHQHSTTSFHRNRCLAGIISISFSCWDTM